MKKLVILATCLMLASTAGAAIVKKERGLFCDTKAKFCFDRTGLSATFSQQYYGEAGYQRAAQIMSTNSKQVVLSDGTDCHFDEQICYVSKYDKRRDRKVSPALWGE